jgi:hypothetical protein
MQALVFSTRENIFYWSKSAFYYYYPPCVQCDVKHCCSTDILLTFKICTTFKAMSKSQSKDSSVVRIKGTLIGNYRRFFGKYTTVLNNS